jgi:aspartyl-tRNA(Asn)/glutamyl-tRNA(Gln) amidotransferase subunit B
LSQQQLEIGDYPVAVETLAELIARVSKGELPTNRGREVLGRLIDQGGDVALAMEALGIQQVDEDAERELCQKLLQDNPHIVADIKEGKLKAAGALIGLAKQRNPNVNPGRVRELCLELAQEM